jgi:hypothetical protein
MLERLQFTRYRRARHQTKAVISEELRENAKG